MYVYNYSIHVFKKAVVTTIINKPLGRVPSGSKIYQS